MNVRNLVVIGAVMTLCTCSAASVGEAAVSASAYLSVEFYAGINDTIRDTTLSGGSAQPGVPTLAMVTSSSCLSGKLMTFALYGAATLGTAAWAETHQCVSIEPSNGYVHVVLGQIHPISNTLINTATLYLEVTIENDTLLPRIALLSAWRSMILSEISFESGMPFATPAAGDSAPKVYGVGYGSPGAVATSRSRLRPKAIAFADAASSPMAHIVAGAERGELIWRVHEYEKTIASLRAEMAELRRKLPTSR